MSLPTQTRAWTQEECAVNDLPYAHGLPLATGTVKASIEDFVVDESLSFTPDGEGEHVLLRIEKRNTNTQWLAGELARFAGVRPRDVGYAGLKDRHAVTRQWFSVPSKIGHTSDWSAFNSDDWHVIEHVRHRRKLRRGSLAGNTFYINVRDLSVDPESLRDRVLRIARLGVPNFFGEQRFGYDNLTNAVAKLTGNAKIKQRHRGIYLSAIRSALFNHLLAQRVSEATWHDPLCGDVMMLSGSKSIFLADVVTDELRERVASHDVAPTGPLWGQGRPLTTGEVLRREMSLLRDAKTYCEILESAGLKHDRRALILNLTNLDWRYDVASSVLRLSFQLSPGGYATIVLRELVYDRRYAETVEK